METATLHTASVAAGSADAVTLWHVLEHLEDPGAAIDRVHGWLTPGGALVVAVPNLDSWQARVGGPSWFHLDAARHRTHFTPAGLGRPLARHGFDVVAIEHRLLEHNPFGLWQSALNRVGGRPSWLFGVLKGNADWEWEWAQAGLCLAALPLVPIAVVVGGVASAGGNGGRARATPALSGAAVTLSSAAVTLTASHLEAAARASYH